MFVELAVGLIGFNDVDVEEPDRIGLEGLLRGLAAIDLRQPVDAMTLETRVQSRTRQVRDRGL